LGTAAQPRNSTGAAAAAAIIRIIVRRAKRGWSNSFT
jgi:hypothetical protein